MGAGVKAGAFPSFAAGVLGFEGELFGHGGKVSAPRSTQGTQAQGDLAVINLMVNLIARYPGDILQPYIGAGLGYSSGKFSDANIQTSPFILSGKASAGAFAYQFLAGVRAYVAKKVFLFGEYKYFAADYKWETEGINTGNPPVKLDFRMQIVSGGLGISFILGSLSASRFRSSANSHDRVCCRGAKFPSQDLHGDTRHRTVS